MEQRKQFSGYYLTPEADSSWCMVLQGPWTTECEKTFQKEKVTGLRLSYSLGWQQTDLSFLQSLELLRSVEIYNWNVTDITPLTALKKLGKIGIECNYKTPIDFAAFQKLEQCFLKWRPKSESIFGVSTLKELNVVNYPYYDLSTLHALKDLETLKLTSEKLSSLNGASMLGELVTLDLFRCTKLETLEGIQGAAKIVNLELDSCKNINSVEPLSKLRSLRRIAINNCGNIKSLLPLTSCKELKELFFIENTIIEDGDLSVFQNLSKLTTMWFSDRKHYSHTRTKIQKLLETR